MQTQKNLQAECCIGRGSPGKSGSPRNRLRKRNVFPLHRVRRRRSSGLLPLNLPCFRKAKDWLLLLLLGLFASPALASTFEGCIQAVSGPAGAPAHLLYTISTNFMRVERTATNPPHAIDVVNLRSGQITLIQPRNDTFVRFTPGAPKAFVPPPHANHPGGGIRSRSPREAAVKGPGDSQGRPRPAEDLPPGIGPRAHPEAGPAAPDMPKMPMPPGGLPPGIGPQTHAGNTPSASAKPSMPEMPAPPGGLPPGIGPQAHTQATPTQRAMPTMPAMAMPPPEKLDLELKATGGRTNLFTYPCRRYEITYHGQIMEIWATDQLLPFQVYLPTEPHRLGPPILEEQWGQLLAAKKLFPLSAVLRMEGGPERYRFEVRSIAPRRLTREEAAGFQPPEGYVELQPRPF